MNKNDKEFPKYQWSYFVDGDRNSQIVVRTNSTKEMENAILKVLPIIEKIKTTTYQLEPPKEQPVEQGLTATCSVHKDASGNPIKLKQKTSKAGKEYWAHWRKVGNKWDICFGKGWESEKTYQLEPLNF